jgi:hypothetical protein
VPLPLSVDAPQPSSWEIEPLGWLFLHMSVVAHISLCPPRYFSKTWTFCIAFSCFRFLLISSLIHHPDVGGTKNKKKTGGGRRTCERLSDWRISFEHLSTWVTLDPSKSTCQTRYRGRANLVPNFTCQESLIHRWGRGRYSGRKGDMWRMKTWKG